MTSIRGGKAFRGKAFREKAFQEKAFSGKPFQKQGLSNFSGRCAENPLLFLERAIRSSLEETAQCGYLPGSDKVSQSAPFLDHMKSE